MMTSFSTRIKLPGFLILLFAALALQISTEAWALGLKIYEKEKAVFAFFKLSERDPEYNRWIESFPEFSNEESMSKKQQFYDREEARLKWGFGTYNPEKDFLKVKTEVRMQLVKSGSGGTLYFNFPNFANAEIPYFPYPYGEEWIAFIVNDLGSFMTASLTEEEFTHIHNHLSTDREHAGNLYMRLRPLSADNSAPIELDGVSQWMMVGDIAYLKLGYSSASSKEEVELWEYTAPWYLSETEADLLQLLGE